MIFGIIISIFILILLFVSVKSLEVENIISPDEMRRMMEKQMKAERNRER